MPEPGSAKRRRLISRMGMSPASRARQGSPELEWQAWKSGVLLISPEISQPISRKIYPKICRKISPAAQGSSFYWNNRSRTTRTL